MSSEREQFKTLCDESGILDSISRVLCALYDDPNRPVNPMEYIKTYLGNPKGVDPNALKNENAKLRQEIQQLEEQIKQQKTTS